MGNRDFVSDAFVVDRNAGKGIVEESPRESRIPSLPRNARMSISVRRSDTGFSHHRILSGRGHGDNVASDDFASYRFERIAGKIGKISAILAIRYVFEIGPRTENTIAMRRISFRGGGGGGKSLVVQ